MKPSLEGVVNRYQKSLYAVAYSVCRNSHDAEDVVQETFLQYLRNKGEFDSEDHVRAWLIRVAINRAKNRVRSPFSRVAPLEEDQWADKASESRSIDLLDAVMRLPQRYRIPLHLFYYEDYSIRDIARILRISEGATKTRLSRARVALRKTLGEGWEDD